MANAAGLPSVTIHFAQTLDGRLATRDGESRWIGGQESLAFAHRLRAEHDAVLVGTVLKDDPRLTVRLVAGASPLRVVLDASARTPLSANVLANGAAAGTVICAGPRAPRERLDALRAAGARLLLLPEDAAGNLDLTAALAGLADLGVRSLMVEGGARVITSFLAGGFADRLVVCLAPLVLGEGLAAVGDLGHARLAEALSLGEMQVKRLGQDLLVEARLPRRPPPSRELRTAAAVWFSAARQAEVRREPLPQPGQGEVLVEAELSAVSQGTELLVYRGEALPELPLDLPTLAGSYALPIKYGYASVGQVRAVGHGVRDLTPGQRVFALHPHQSAYVLPATLARALPADLAPEAGVFAANLETALNVVLDAPPRLGETAVVFGQGVVGLLLTQLLHRAGAVRIVAVEPGARRRALALALGADAALAPAEATPARLRELAGGRPPDLVYEVSGSAAALQQAVDCLAPEGTIVAVSWYGRRPVQLDLGANFHRGRLRLVSTQVGSLNPALAPRWDRERRWQTVLALLPQLRLAELVSHRFPLAEAPAVYRLLDEGREETAQVVFTYDGNR